MNEEGEEEIVLRGEKVASYYSVFSSFNPRCATIFELHV